MPVVLISLILGTLGTTVARGDVTTSIVGSKLVLTGDTRSETLVIEPAADGVTVLGLGGTLVDGSSERVSVPGVRRLAVKLHEGADRITLSDVDFPDGIDLRLGRGNDDVYLDRVRTGTARIRTGSGHDAVEVSGRSNVDRLTISTGSDWDRVLVDGAWIADDLVIDGGPEPDDVTIVATDVGDDVDVDLGNDDDLLVLADVVVYDDGDLDGDDGDDELVFYGYVRFEDDLDIDGFDDDVWW